MEHKWVDEEFPYKTGAVPTFVGSHEYADTPIPGPAQSYRNADNSLDGRVFPFNNGDGWRWCAVTNEDMKRPPFATSYDSLEAAKRHVEQVMSNQAAVVS